jgi:ureidoglycolate hydrolase
MEAIMKVHAIKLESLKHVSMEDFSPFGRIIGRIEDYDDKVYNLHPMKPMEIPDNGVDIAVKVYWDLLPFENKGERFSLGMVFVKPKPEGTIIDWTECHPDTYEVFLPLGGKEFIFVLCPKGSKPDPEKTRAFLIGPDEGILLDKGTWHFPPYAPYGITPIVMPRYGDLAEIEGPVTTAFGKKHETPSPPFIRGALHCLNTMYYGKNYDGEYNIKVV